MSDLVIHSGKGQMATQKFNQIFEREKNRLLGFVAKNVSDFAEAEDITQEVFSQFYEAYDVMQPIENTSAWLYRMARNKIVDLFRRRKTRENYAGNNPAKDRSDESPEKQQWSKAMMAAMYEALQELPVEQSEVFIKTELEGKSFKELAQETGEKINTLISRKRYAVVHLREQLLDYYDDIND